MPPVTSDTLNARREKDCFAITNERKYYHLAADRAFVKRSLRPTEWQYGPPGGLRSLFIPARGDDRILNEAAALRFLADTSVPVPKLYACFQDDEAAYLVTEYVDGVAMASLDEEKRKPVEKDVEVHLATLRSLTSDTWGGVTGLVRLSGVKTALTIGDSAVSSDEAQSCVYVGWHEASRGKGPCVLPQ